MKFTSIEVRAIGRRSAMPSLFYEIVNRGMDGILAPADILLKSVQSPSLFLAWLSGNAPESQQWTTHYSYLEPLNQEELESNEFLIRATKRQTDGGRVHHNVWLFGDRQLNSVRIDWRGRSNMAFAGHVLYDLQEELRTRGLPWDSIDMHVEGYVREAHIKETLLAAFEFDASKGHMNHKKAELRQFDLDRRNRK